MTCVYVKHHCHCTYMFHLSIFNFRVRLVPGGNFDSSFHFGISSTLVFVIWALCGGLINHMVNANLFTVMVKPTYDDPLDSVYDVLNSGKKVFYIEGGEYIQQLFAMSEDPAFKGRFRKNYEIFQRGDWVAHWALFQYFLN